MILINLSAKRVGILIKIGEISGKKTGKGQIPEICAASNCCAATYVMPKRSFVFGLFWLFVASGQRAILSHRFPITWPLCGGIVCV